MQPCNYSRSRNVLIHSIAENLLSPTLCHLPILIVSDFHSHPCRADLEVNNKLCSGPGNLHQLTWWKDNTLLAVGKLHEDGTSVICEILLTEVEDKFKAEYLYVNVTWSSYLIYILMMFHERYRFFYCLK